MNTKELTQTELADLMEMLADKDGMVRQDAREQLVRQGQLALPPLKEALVNAKSDQVRWEAAKALGEIADPDSIPALVQALSDSNFDVSWLAAEALKKFKTVAWPSILRTLVEENNDSSSLYRGAHHVLIDQKEEKFKDQLAVLLKDLEQGGLSESAVVAAHELLERIDNGN